MDNKFINYIVDNWPNILLLLYVCSSLIATIINRLKHHEKVSLNDIISCINIAELSIPGRKQGITKKDFCISLLENKYKLNKNDISKISKQIDDIVETYNNININKELKK